MIPEDWDSQKLEEVCINIVDCHHSTPAWTNDGFIVLRTQNIRDGVIDFSSVSFTDELHYYERIKRAVPEEGDIVVTREAPAGEVALIPAEMKVCLGQRLVLVKVNHKLVSSLYIKFYLMSSLVQRNVFQLQSNGSTVGNIRIPVLKSINLLLPPLSEQRKIAEILSTWDKAIALLEQLITAKRKLKQGLMQQLLTGKKRFKEFEGSEWHIGMLNELGKSQFPTVKAGPFGSSVKKEFYTNRGYKIYGQEQVIANSPFIGEYYIDEARFQTLKSCEVLPNDILISLVGTIGRVLLIPDNAEVGIINPRLLRIRLDQKKVLPLFAKYFLESEAILKLMNNLAQGGTMGVLNANLVKTVPFPILRIEEQQKIASILSAADTEISNLEKQLAAYKQQKRGLMQQLLTGKKRVKLDEPQMQKV